MCRCDARLGGDAGAGPVLMASAMRNAVEAGRLAFRAGRIPRRHFAEASSPTTGVACLDPERPAF